MPVDLVALLSGVPLLLGAVDAAGETVERLRTRFGKRAADASDQLNAELERLRNGLDDIGTLARAADGYLSALDETRSMQVELVLVSQYVDGHRGVLHNHLDTAYESTWRALGTMVDATDRQRRILIEAHLSRQDWFDQRDDEMIGSRLNDTNTSFALLADRVRSHQIDGLPAAVQGVQKPLREAEALLRNTLSKRILSGLQSLQEPR